MGIADGAYIWSRLLTYESCKAMDAGYVWDYPDQEGGSMEPGWARDGSNGRGRGLIL